ISDGEGNPLLVAQQNGRDSRAAEGGRDPRRQGARRDPRPRGARGGLVLDRFLDRAPNRPLAAPLFVAGRGKVGRSLAHALKVAGHPARLFAARGGSRRLVGALASEPQAIVFLAVPDGAVP